MTVNCFLCKKFQKEYIEWDLNGKYTIEYHCILGHNHNEYNKKKKCPDFFRCKNE